MINANSLFQDTGYFSDRNECGIPVGVGDGSGGGDTGSSGGGGGEGPGDHYSGQRSTGEGHGEHYGSQRSTEEKEFFTQICYNHGLNLIMDILEISPDLSYLVCVFLVNVTLSYILHGSIHPGAHRSH